VESFKSLANIHNLKNVLIIFVRNPELGKVKTRLARTLGDSEALRIYLFLLEKTRAAALGVSADRLLCYSESIPPADTWPRTAFMPHLQVPGDLGQKMEAAFRYSFEQGAQKALIIGSDCPELTGDILQAAFDALDKADFVLGPVPDGGYYLLGMRQFESSVFQHIDWSTAAVRTQTLAAIDVLGKTVHTLPMLTDIDEEADWVAFQQREQTGGSTDHFPSA
jgi:uncharacterized protein